MPHTAVFGRIGAVYLSAALNAVALVVLLASSDELSGKSPHVPKHLLVQSADAFRSMKLSAQVLQLESDVSDQRSRFPHSKNKQEERHD